MFLNLQLNSQITKHQRELSGLENYAPLLDAVIKNKKASLANNTFNINLNNTEKALQEISINSQLATDNDLASNFMNRAIVEDFPLIVRNLYAIQSDSNTVFSNGGFGWSD